MAKPIVIPKHTQLRLYLHNEMDRKSGQRTKELQKEGKNFVVTGVVLVGYCPDTLDYFNALYEHAKLSFPNLAQSEITCGKVTKSSNIQGFTLLIFSLTAHLKGWEPVIEETNEHYTSYKPYKAPNGELWSVYKNLDFNY